MTEFKTIVADWHQQFSKLVSHKTRLISDSIVAILDYSNVAKVQRLNQSSLFLVKIGKSNGQKTNTYLSIANTNKGYQAEGIYIANDLEHLKNFLTTQKLMPGDNFILNNIDKTPSMAWEFNASGKMLFKLAKQKKINSLNPIGQKVSTLSTQPKSTYVQDPEACTAWYYIEYDINTGAIDSITYLDTTCPNSGGGTPATGVTETQVLDAFENSFSVTDLKGPITTSAETVISRDRLYDWQICDGKTWQGYSHEKGTHVYSYSGNRWNWSTFEHVNVTKQGTIIGGSVDISDVSSAPRIYPQYAGMTVNYHVVWSLIFKGTPAFREKDYTSNVLYEVNEQ